MLLMQFTQERKRLQYPKQRLHCRQLLHPPLMTHRRNQRHLHGRLILKCKNGQLSFNSPPGRLVHVRNLKGIRQSSSSVMVNGLQENMKNSYTKQLKLVTTRYGIEKLVKKPRGTVKSCSVAWENGSEKSKVEASKTIHQFLMVHLLREFRPRELFQKFTMLSVRMILPRLQRHSRTFQRKPLQQQAGVDQQLSIQEMNLQGFVLHQCSLHHHQGQRLHGMFKLKVPSMRRLLLP